MRNLIAFLSLLCVAEVAAAKIWGRSYFPDTELVTEEGRKVKFFTDLIENKIVAINFIYTTCPDTCPLETARLVRVQDILGERLGKDVHFYSISIDPKVDTPEVLKGYKDRFGAKWTFLTGKEKDIEVLRKKLGLFIQEIQDGSNNHNVSMIIGNQKTGRWMKRSPFENAHVLADQLGNWLDGYRRPQKVASYEHAPEVRQISDGESLFRTRCVSCHTIDGSNSSKLGPELLGIVDRRGAGWLVRWLRNPDAVREDKDPIIMGLREKYTAVQMPNMRLSSEDIAALLSFFRKETAHVKRGGQVMKNSDAPMSAHGHLTVANGWIRVIENAPMNAGFFTLVNSSKQSVAVTKIESQRFGAVEMHEMVEEDGMMEMRELTELKVEAGQSVEFKPHGKHLMMMKPTPPVKPGETIELTLTYADGMRQTVALRARKHEM